jgi:hypothetical protein
MRIHGMIVAIIITFLCGCGYQNCPVGTYLNGNVCTTSYNGVTSGLTTYPYGTTTPYGTGTYPYTYPYYGYPYTGPTIYGYGYH